MSFRDRLSVVEQYLAYVIGLGIALAIIALLLMGLGNTSSSSTNGMLLVGLALIVIGTAAWLFLERPWTQYDDLTTPYYTGHHEDHAEEAVAEAPAEPLNALPPAEPETAEDAKLGEAVPGTAGGAGRPEVAEPTGEGPIAPAPKELEAAPETAAAPGEDVPPPPAEPETAEDAKLGEAVPGTAGGAETPEVAEPTGEGPVAPAPEELEAEPVEESPAAPAPPETEAQAVSAAPAAVSEKRDNLLLIDGLGPKSQQVLYDAGITTFQALANASPEMLNDILKAAGLRLVRADTWPEQAERLAAGDPERYGS